MRHILPILLLALAAIAFSQRPGRDYSPEDIRRSVRDVAARAEIGDAEATYQLARLHERGYDSIPADSLRAMELYSKAADSGYLPALNYLGYKLIQSGKRKETMRGLSLLEQAAMAGDAKAQSNIGFLLIEGNNVEKDYDKAVFWLERAAQQGMAQASSMLGDLYRDGLGVERDSLQAAAHYYAAVDAGLTDAAYKLQALDSVRWKTLPPKERLERAEYFFTHRAPDIAIPLLNELSEMDVPADMEPEVKEADEEGTEAMAAKGRALLLLGDAYARAQGVGYDFARSIDYYRRAAEAGNTEAEEILRELLEIFPDILD